MLKKFVNECRFTLTLETKSPFLIKDGNYKKTDKGTLDAIFIKGRTVDKTKPQQPVIHGYYIPGTSLRGVIRSHTEKIVRTIVNNDANPICCDPFDDQVSCSKRLDSTRSNKQSSPSYANTCVICKLFGCTGTASRIQVHDSAISRQGIVGVRDGIGIDRFTGGVSSGANFKNEVLEGYTFQSEITIRNFELWQLGLLAYVFSDFKQELVTLGFGKSKGFGRVKGTIGEIRIAYYGNKTGTVLTDIGDLLEKKLPENQRVYGFVEGNLTDDSLLKPLTSSDELTYRREFRVVNHQNFWKACAKVWNDAKFKSIPQLRATANKAEHPEAAPEVSNG